MIAGSAWSRKNEPLTHFYKISEHLSYEIKNDYQSLKSKSKIFEFFKMEVRKIAQIKSFVQSIEQIMTLNSSLLKKWTKKWMFEISSKIWRDQDAGAPGQHSFKKNTKNLAQVI